MEDDKIQPFLSRMAARYIPGKRKGDDVFELYTTDTGRTYRVRVSADKCELNVATAAPFAARIETTSSAFIEILEGKLNIFSALMKRQVRIKGNILLIKDLPRYFDLAGITD